MRLNQLFGGLMDVVRCDEPGYLVWKWHPEGTQAGETRRENQVRCGSKLIVKSGQVAVLALTQGNGARQEFIEGPEEMFLETRNLPVLADIIGAAYGGNSPFPAEVYFVNMIKGLQMKFAVSYFKVRKDETDLSEADVAVRGTITFGISDCQSFIERYGLRICSVKDFETIARAAIVRIVKDEINRAVRHMDIPLSRLERRIDELNTIIGANVCEHFHNVLGVNVSRFDIMAIDVEE